MIHQYQLNGYNIVLDVYSGSVHLVDEVAYDMIAMYETNTPEEIISAMLAKYAGRPDVTEAELRECLQDIDALKQAGKLFSKDPYRIWHSMSNRNPTISRHCACMWRTPAI